MSVTGSRNNPFITLPEELHLLIFSYLDCAELGNCCQVSSNWNRLASDNRLWMRWGEQQFRGFRNVPNVKKFLKEYRSQQLGSNEEIVDRIQEFVTRVPLGHNGRFRCIINPGRGYRVISVEIKADLATFASCRYSEFPEEIRRKFDIHEVAFASHVVGKGDLKNPEPLDDLNYSHDSGYSNREGEKMYYFNVGCFCAAVQIPNVSESETNFQTWDRLKRLTYPTQMHKKIVNIVRRKISH